MALEQFIEVRFQQKTLEIVKLVNSIVAELAADGYTVTLRQVFYQLVQMGILPNKQREYKNLGETLSKARLGGMLDWDAIEDRTRSLRGIPHRETPEEILKDAAEAFRMDKWRNQKYRPEVWVEKDALVGVLQKACEPLDVDYFSCRGNTSQTAMYNAALRYRGYFEQGQIPLVIHLGDHDPSGIDMTRDIFDRLELMVTQVTGEEIEVRRIALNMDQVRQYNPPPNPAKQTDSRYKEYAKKYGTQSWELDALNVRVLDKLITDTIIEHRDNEQWEKDVAIEDRHRAQLKGTVDNWEEVAGFVDDPGRFLKVDNEEEASGTPAELKKQLHSLLCHGIEKSERNLTIFDEAGNYAVHVPLNEFSALLKPARKQSTSIKTKKPKPSKS